MIIFIGLIALTWILAIIIAAQMPLREGRYAKKEVTTHVNPSQTHLPPPAEKPRMEQAPPNQRLPGNQPGGAARPVRQPHTRNTRGQHDQEGQGMIQINETGEVAGLGPVYVCDKFGQAGHDYYTCETCMERFERHMKTGTGDREGGKQMNTIDIITIVISREHLTIQVVGENIVKEEYLRDKNGLLDCVVGNFGEEPIFGDNDDLVSALNTLCDAAADAQNELNK
jgi:hypothetical protein